VTLALHKLADGFTLTSLFSQNGMNRRSSLAGLLLVAAATPLGCAVKSLGLRGLPPAAEAALLGFAAGSFIYIGAADILPRIHKTEDKTTLGYFAMGLIGLAALKNL
jgi:zinc transporter ZupT